MHDALMSYRFRSSISKIYYSERKKSRSANLKPFFASLLAFHDRTHDRNRLGKIRKQHVRDVLSCAIRCEVIFTICLLFHKQHVRMLRGRQICIACTSIQVGKKWDPRVSYERRVPHLKRRLRRKRAVGGLQGFCTGGLLVTCRAQIYCGDIKSRTGGLNGETSIPTWKDDET